MLAIALVCLSLTCSGGCCTAPGDAAPPLGQPDQRATDKPTGDLNVLDTFPLHARAITFNVTIDRQQPKRHSSGFRNVDDKTWMLEVSDLRKIWFRLINDEIHVLRDVDHAENVTVQYDPPLRFLSSELQRDKPVVGESKMIVRNLQTDAVRDEGTCAYRVEWIADKEADTNFGKLDVIHIRMTRNIKLNLATVDITIDQLRHPKYGLVRGYTVRNTKALGLIGGTATEDMMLVESKSADSSDGTNANAKTKADANDRK